MSIHSRGNGKTMQGARSMSKGRNLKAITCRLLAPMEENVDHRKILDDMLSTLRRERANEDKLCYEEKLLVWACYNNADYGTKGDMKDWLSTKLGVSTRTIRKYGTKKAERMSKRARGLIISGETLDVILQLCKENPGLSNRDIRGMARLEHGIHISRETFRRWRRSTFVKRALK